MKPRRARVDANLAHLRKQFQEELIEDRRASLYARYR
jgi:hypothetical protein